jgi:hypothetical protein
VKIWFLYQSRRFKPQPTQTRDVAIRPWIGPIEKLSRLPFTLVALIGMYIDFDSANALAGLNLGWWHLDPANVLMGLNLNWWLTILAELIVPSFVAASSFLNYSNRRILEATASLLSGADDGMFAKEAIYAASKGKLYRGPSSSWWYGPRDLETLLHAAPPSATAAERYRIGKSGTVVPMCSRLAL